MDEIFRPLPPAALIGMIHLPPLPGHPHNRLPLSRIVDQALLDTRTLVEAGFDALIIENFGDAPFRPIRVDPHTVAGMTVVTQALCAEVAVPIGINVLRNDAQAALAIATICGAAFIRVNVHCGVYATDQGFIEGRADETIRYRGVLASKVAVLADVHVKHASPLLNQSLAEAARETAYRGRADGLIVSGAATGRPTALTDLREARAAVPDRPIYVGSGADAESVAELLRIADGVIAGTSLKKDGQTTASVDPQRAENFVKAARI
ncbi:MAG: BtpA/SgcQ family protein [Phycisphaerales bacterium]|nr:BtpA/SgcQ family protein [Phycisphaerales bacterium]